MKNSSEAYVYVVNAVPVNGKVEYLCLDILNDVLWVDVTPKLPKKMNPEFPPYIPRFHTDQGTYLLLHDLEHLTDAFMELGFDLAMPGCLVNMSKVTRIKSSIYGNMIVFANGAEVPISRNKSNSYPHLIE
ncbi:MAG: LytTr DNA-binding domain [Paenibacillaceae bacterium]|jgi:hypothetical protein|nr:LytTr DNA-binding domain [Paenibacillaceae bacterium]